jgi:hypothetical protein
MFARVMVSIAAACLVAGCSSRILHSEISPKLAPGSEVAGVPYRVPKRFKVTIYQKTGTGYQPLKDDLSVVIPDPDHLYVLGFRSQPLSTATLDIQMNVDNTLQQVALKSSPTGAAALTAVGTGLTTVATAEQARRTAEQTAKTAEKTAETAAATLAIAADKAKQAADLAELQYQLAKANPETSAENLLKAANLARSTKLDANEAARLAGRAPYFPEVVP